MKQLTLLYYFDLEVNECREFEITPKAFANFSPGFERSKNPGT